MQGPAAGQYVPPRVAMETILSVYNMDVQSLDFSGTPWGPSGRWSQEQLRERTHMIAMYLDNMGRRDWINRLGTPNKRGLVLFSFAEGYQLGYMAGIA